jgi:hypothetical protein
MNDMQPGLLFIVAGHYIHGAVGQIPLSAADRNKVIPTINAIQTPAFPDSTQIANTTRSNNHICQFSKSLAREPQRVDIDRRRAGIGVLDICLCNAPATSCLIRPCCVVLL